MANYQNVTYQTRVFAERVLTLKGERSSLLSTGPFWISNHGELSYTEGPSENDVLQLGCHKMSPFNMKLKFIFCLIASFTFGAPKLCDSYGYLLTVKSSSSNEYRVIKFEFFRNKHHCVGFCCTYTTLGVSQPCSFHAV